MLAIGLGLVLSLAMPFNAAAGAYTWTGLAGSGSWSTAGNWNAAPVFDNTADLTFSGSVQPATFLVSIRTIRSLVFDANADTAFSIRLTSTAINTTGRNLTLGGGVAPSITIDAGASAAHILGVSSGNIVLAGDLTITHNGPANFTIDQPITGAFSLTKTGSGMLTLSGANTFGAAKTLTLSNGTINVNSTTALGGATCTNKIISGTLDNTSGAAITLANNQPVTIAGNFAFTGLAGGTHDLNLGTGALTLNGVAGARTITANAGTLTLGGIIGNGTATALTKAGGGTLKLGGANTYSGDTTISAGTLQLGAANRIPDGAGKGNVSVTGTFDLNTFSETINGLSGAGIVDTVAGGSPILTVGANDQTSEFSGTIANTAGTLALIKIGTGTLTLSGANTYSGSTIVSGGTLLVNGSLGGGQVAVTNGGTLGGTGSLSGAVFVYPGSTLAPGSNAIGILTGAGGVTLTGGIFKVNVTTTNPGNYGQVKVTGGNVTITNTTLAVSGSGYTPKNKDNLWIINNTSAGTVSGTFNGLPEGGQTNIAARAFKIYYHADFATGVTNGGNDVLLSIIPVPVAQTITNFTPTNGAAFLTTDAVSLFAQASSGLVVTNFTVISGPGVLTGLTNLTFTNSGTVRVAADQVGDAYWITAPSITNTFTVTKATATVTFNSLVQTYDGSARPVTVTTAPTGLTVVLTYNGNLWAPTNAGSYVVTGLVNEAIYQGTNTGTLAVSAQTPQVTSWGTASDITYGQAFSNSTLNGVAATNAAGANVPGALAFDAPATMPNAGLLNVAVTFTPADSVNYTTAAGTVVLNVIAPPSGWFSPGGVDAPGGQWANGANAIDGNTATYAAHTSPGADQWGAPLWLTNAMAFKCGRVRVYSDWDAGYVDKIRLEIRIQPSGVWSNVFEGSVANCNWSEITFASTNMDAARYSYHYVAANITFWLYEFQFYADAAQVNLPACESLEATSVEEASANLHGVVVGDGGEPCQYRFQYGLTTSYTTNTDWSGSLSVNSDFSASISGLATNSTYHFRAQVKNSAGISSSSDEVLTTGLPPTGWVSPMGYASSGTWTNIPNAFDDNLTSFATCYHKINDPAWSPYLYLTHSTMTCERVRFNARKTAEIDMAAVDVDLNGVWTNVYTNTFSDKQWVEASFPRGTVTQARISFSLNATTYGMDWQLYEFNFYRVVGVTLSGRYDGAHRVSLAVDGQYRASFTNFATNVFTFAESVGAGSKILIFYDDDNIATNSGALVTKATGADMANLDLTANTIILRNDYGTELTRADLAIAYLNDADVPYSCSGNTITVASNIAMRIPPGNVFTPGFGALTLYDNLINDGVLNFSGGTAVFAGRTILSGVSTTAFGNVTITGGLTAHSNLMQVAGNLVQNGVFSNNNGAVEFNGNTIISGSSTASFNHVEISGALTASTGTLKVADGFINNGSFNHNNGTVMFSGASVIGGTAATTFGDLVIAASSSLTAPPGALYVSGNWINNGIFYNNNGTVVFTTPSTATITGSNTFYNFTCTIPGKQINFAAGTNQTVLGTFTVAGNSGSQMLLRSSSGTTKWRISFPNGPQSVTYVDVRDSDALSNTVTVAGGTDSGNNNANWVFASSRYWVGGNGNWSDTSHWALFSGGGPGASVPDSGNLVAFDANSGVAGAQCMVDQTVNVKAMILDTLNAVTLNQGANNITIQSAGFQLKAGTFNGGSGRFDTVGSFQLSGGVFLAPSNSLILRSDFTHNGGVFSNNAGTVVFAGNTVMSDSIANPFAHIVISNSVTAPSGVMRVAGNWADHGTFNPNNGTVVFAGNSAISGVSTTRFNHITISGTLTGSPKAISVNGAWVNNGVFDPANGAVQFSGNTEISGSSTSVFDNVTVKGTLAGHALKPVVIAGAWLNNGTFNPNNGAVIFSGNTEISGSSISAFNKVTITGALVGHASKPVSIAGDWVQNGTFNNNNGTVIFNGISTLGGTVTSLFHNVELWGQLTAPATNLYISGNWINHGIFSNNNGSVVFNGTSLLSGANQSLFNNLTVAGGSTLDLARALGADAVTVLGTINLNGINETIGSLAGSGQVQLGTASLAVSGPASSTFSGSIRQNGSVIRQGTGTLTLSGNNTYIGDTSVEAGTLRIGAANALPILSTLRMGNTNNIGTAWLDLAGFSQQVGGLITSGTTMPMVATNSAAPLATLTVNNDLSCSYAGLIGGNVALVKAGVGTLTLGGGTNGLTFANTYLGDTVVSYGLLAISSNSLISSSTNITVLANGQLAIGNTNNVINDNASVYLQTGAKLILTNGVNETVWSLYFDGQLESAGTWGTVNCQFTNTDFFAGNGKLNVLNGVALPVLTITNTTSGLRLPFRATQYTVAGRALNVVGNLWYTNAWSQGLVTGSIPAGDTWILPLSLPRKGAYTIHVCGTNASGTVVRDSVTITRDPSQIFWFGR